MHINQRKQLFSIAYIKALTAPLGFNPNTPTVDDDSVDISFSAKNYRGRFREPMINFQLKCTEMVFSNDGFLHFPLKKKNYEDLRGDDLIIPRFLIVLLVPDVIDKWIIEGQRGMILKYSSYYLSLRNYPPIDTETSKTVLIPKTNRLTRNVLSNMMINVSNGVM